MLRFFNKDGPVAKAVGRYEERPQQAEMACAVARALEGGGHLVVEAGTGVGKSLAYLAPAAMWALARGKRVAVATYSKALQEQLVKKDIPGLAKALAAENKFVTSALLMGSENYLCLRRLDIALRRQAGLFDSPARAEILNGLRACAATARTGLRQELPLRVPEQLWENVRRESELCAGKLCPKKDFCLWRRDVSRARAAQITVVNHHLFFAGMYGIPWDAAILDEAHNIEDVSAQYLGASVSGRDITRILDGIFSASSKRGSAARFILAGTAEGDAVSNALDAAASAADDFFSAAARNAGIELQPRSVRVTKPDFAPDTITPALAGAANALANIISRAKDMEEELALKSSRDKLTEAVSALKRFLKCDSRDFAYWVEGRSFRGRTHVSLQITPLDVSGELAKTLFASGQPVIMTSATLAVDGGFDYFRKRTGLPPCEDKIISSPFDYRKQAGLYIASDMPCPRNETQAYEAAVIKAAEEIIRSVDGGVFVLFTSWNFLQRAAGEIAAKLGSRPLFIQGEMQPSVLVKEFKTAGNGVLFATDTFWQGVDVPGKALSCVIITRLPFLAPDSPVEQARAQWYAERGQEIFGQYTLPRAVIKFHQGFGRLIRRKSDRGAVAVLDPRILGMRYGAKFIGAVPQCARLESAAELRVFFAESRTEEE